MRRGRPSNDRTNGGLDTATHGDIGNGQGASLTTTVTGPKLLTFSWKVSSEAGFDFLRLLLDGTDAVPAVSGNVPWTAVQVPIPAGPHTLRWVYEKDDSVSSGQDQAWLDGVVFMRPAWGLTILPTASAGQFHLPVRGANAFHLGLQNGGLNFVESGQIDNVLFLEPGGNVGIGTGDTFFKLNVNGPIRGTTVSTNDGISVGGTITVAGDVRTGNLNSLIMPVAAERLRIVRGLIASNATIQTGTGFTVTNPAAGRYTITFDTPFNGNPPSVSIVVGSTNEPVIATYTGISSTFVSVTQFLPNGAPAAFAFSFIAVSPR